MAFLEEGQECREQLVLARHGSLMEEPPLQGPRRGGGGVARPPRGPVYLCCGQAKIQCRNVLLPRQEQLAFLGPGPSPSRHFR